MLSNYIGTSLVSGAELLSMPEAEGERVAEGNFGSDSDIPNTPDCMQLVPKLKIALLTRLCLSINQ